MRGLITNSLENCVGCNRCLRVCPIDEANIASQRDGKNIVEVDGTKCIACGACLAACQHGSRNFVDDTARFFNDLRSGVPISIIAAPAFKTNFHDWERMLSWLRDLGGGEIYDVSLGADICTWAHIRHIQKRGVKPIISQPCPAIVNYILMHRVKLVKYLSPIHSPMLCTAIYMRKYRKIKTKIAALSPCVAKTHEFDATRIVDYNVTFKGLLEYIQEKQVSFPAQPGGFDHLEAGLGSLYPMPGGLKENFEHYLGKSFRVDKSEGPRTVYKAMDEYSHQPVENLPVLFDVLNCAEGCNMGTGCANNENIFEINSMMDRARQKSINESNERYLDNLFDTFDKKLRLEDFIRVYVPVPVKPIQVSPQDIEKAYTALEKYNDIDKMFNCSACGCDTCHEMAVKIAKGINAPLNCIDRAHKNLQREFAEAKENLSSFDDILSGTEQIKKLTEHIIVNIGEITEAITAYNSMATEIEKIAMQVNILAVNASIEAARAGEHGRSFSVVAEEIRRLSNRSDTSAKQTKVVSETAARAIGSVNEMVEEISQSVNASYENVSRVAEKTRKFSVKHIPKVGLQ